MARKNPTGASSREQMQRHWYTVFAASAAVIVVCLAVRFFWPTEAATAAPGQAAAAPASEAPQNPNVVAVVNGEKVTRAELATDCLRHYGKEVLESIVNKELILDHCKASGIKVTNQDIDAEIERMAKRFGVPVEQWLALLQKERGINVEQYRRDIIWPTLALRKLAADRLEVTDKELAEAFEAHYGPQAKVRMIGIYGNEKKAKKAHAEAVANPQDFARLVRTYSEDTESASVNGWIPPLRKHGGDPEVVKAAFALKPGEISPLITIRGQYYVILLGEGEVRAQSVELETVRPQLEELIKEKKLRDEASQIFAKLQQEAKVVNVFNDAQKRKKMPGVAALINGAQIAIDDLSEECLARHGRDTLQGLVNRRLIEQELRRRKIQMTEDHISDEIADAARRNVPLKKDGQPDVETWLKKITSEPGVTVELYVRDSVWPSVAMKLLAKEQVKITDEDLKKAFEAHYGPKVRCLAIVVDDMRKAKEVWEMARQNPSRENFAKLSESYSSDASVSSLKGEIPPIKRFGGRPVLEDEAFALKKGEMSGIIQADEKFVILWCDGRTETMDVKLEEVRQQLYDMVYHQKLNVIMSQKFDSLQASAQVINYLDPTRNREPSKAKAATARREPRVGEAPKQR
jgi:parvulin-like peptidyl-prolyl isomerase